MELSAPITDQLLSILSRRIFNEVLLLSAPAHISINGQPPYFTVYPHPNPFYSIRRIHRCLVLALLLNKPFQLAISHHMVRVDGKWISVDRLLHRF